MHGVEHNVVQITLSKYIFNSISVHVASVSDL